GEEVVARLHGRVAGREIDAERAVLRRGCRRHVRLGRRAAAARGERRGQRGRGQSLEDRCPSLRHLVSHTPSGARYFSTLLFSASATRRAASSSSRNRSATSFFAAAFTRSTYPSWVWYR